MPTILLNSNISLFYETAGSGLPVVFLHGVLGSSEYFFQQKNHPINGAASIFLDFRGHGKSQASDYGHSVSQYAWDVHEILKKLNISRFILVGWSMGALVAWEYIHIFGEKNVAGLVIVDQSPSDFAFKGWPFGTFTLKDLMEIQNAIFKNPQKLAEENAKNIFHHQSKENLSLSVAEFLKVDPKAAHSIFTDQTFRDYRHIALEVSCPVLLCFGRHSSMVPYQAGTYLHERLQDSALVIFEHSSHCPFLEEAIKFNQVVEAFVIKCS
jgi:pimeloyl-ACP methyl ester carboxylesterase